MNYIGSKYSLLKEIEKILKETGIPNTGIALDLFAGTGTISQFLKSMGYITYANDWQYYAYITVSAYISLNKFPEFKKLFSNPDWNKKLNQQSFINFPTYSIFNRNTCEIKNPFNKVLSYLQRLPGKEGAFYHFYCEGGNAKRLYFSKENGLLIQHIRDQIEEWRKQTLITNSEYGWLVATLLESADRVANTTSVYGAYLKQVKESAKKRLRLYALNPIKSGFFSSTKHKVFSLDAKKLLNTLTGTKITLTYIDPPYNHRQYSSNYHLLETIARWDMNNFIPRGITGLRNKKELQSEYCMKSKALKAFESLFKSIKSTYVLFSYNNEGILSENELKNLFENIFKDVVFKKIKYQRYRADIEHENRKYQTNNTQEFLILAKTK